MARSRRRIRHRDPRRRLLIAFAFAHRHAQTPSTGTRSCLSLRTGCYQAVPELLAAPAVRSSWGLRFGDEIYVRQIRIITHLGGWSAKAGAGTRPHQAGIPRRPLVAVDRIGSRLLRVGEVLARC